MGAALIATAEDWAAERGLSEFASDSLLEDTAAHAAHLKVGFEETERCIKYRKPLKPDVSPATRSEYTNGPLQLQPSRGV